MVHPKYAVVGAASMASIITPCRSDRSSDSFVDWEVRVAEAEHEARHNEYVQYTVQVAALQRVMTAEMAERRIEENSTYPEMRSRVAAHVGEKMIQQSHALVDSGEVEGEVEGSDDQIDELRATTKPRGDESNTSKRKQLWKAPPSGRQDTVKNQRKNQNQNRQRRKEDTQRGCACAISSTTSQMIR